jgi:hypothetical protein
LVGSGAAQRFTAVSLLLATGIGCHETGHLEANAMTAQLGTELAVVRRGRILFLHHSVGRNVLDGIARLDAEAGGSQLRIVPVEEAARLDGPVIAEAGGGRNTDPKSKIDAFAVLVRDVGARLRPDVAFMKLCYVDFDPRTEVDDLFAHYRRTMEALKREHPEIRFAHVTVPLTRRPTDLKSSLRRLAGLEVWEDAANVKRAEFNARLAQAFGADPVFDLAQVEATGPDGIPSVFEQAGSRYPALHPRYTEDGGHLNSLGQRAAGAAAIRFAAAALQRPAVAR